jgi:hypothetical protein
VGVEYSFFDSPLKLICKLEYLLFNNLSRVRSDAASADPGTDRNQTSTSETLAMIMWSCQRQHMTVPTGPFNMNFHLRVTKRVIGSQISFIKPSRTDLIWGKKWVLFESGAILPLTRKIFQYTYVGGANPIIDLYLVEFFLLLCLLLFFFFFCQFRSRRRNPMETLQIYVV